MKTAPGEAFFLTGPTASGKSAVAHRLATEAGATVVSADSMNVYRGMDIGTAKPSPAERAQVPYAGIDVVEPTEKFSVAAWLEAVRPAFGGERPVIVAGGTGLYLKCLLEGLDEVPPEDPELRAELAALPLDELRRRAEAEAPALFRTLPAPDRDNPRRLVRLIEKARAGAPPPRAWKRAQRPVLAGLLLPRELLRKRIAERVDRMYENGLLDEARALFERPLSPTARQAIGYAEAFAVLRGECSEREARERTVIRTRQLAKRQMTWMRNQLRVEWVNVEEGMAVEEIARAVRAVWERRGPARVAI